MSADILVRIQAVRAREHLIPELVAKCASYHVETVYDDVEGLPNPWRGYQKCLTDLPDWCSHVLVVQDDAVPCQNVTAAVRKIADNTDCPVSLFVSTWGASKDIVGAMRRARRAQQPYARIPFRSIVPVVAVLWPREHAASLLSWAALNPLLPGGREPRSDDQMAGEWMRKTKQTVLVTVPSLFQHPDVEPSTILEDRHGRVAAIWIGNDDPLTVDWSVR